jgi:hypothetical protein
MTKLKITYRPPSELKPHPKNARTHSRKQIDQIAGSMRRFGFTAPVLVDDESQILAGHGRVEAALLLELTEVPTIRLGDLSEADARAYIIADNRIAENAGWDSERLADEFRFFSELEGDFDMTVTGFDLAETDALIIPAPETSRARRKEDEVPEVEEVAVTRPGDIWQIGQHRLICGDATQAETYIPLLGDEQATVVFSDGPFNLRISGHVSGLGSVRHREFAMASGEMSSAEFTSFLVRTFFHLARHSVDGAIHYQCIDWRHCSEMLEAGSHAYTELKNICVWVKSNAGMGSLYRSAHELVFVFKSGTGPHVNNVELGKNGRHRTNVWMHPGANSFGATRDADLAMHPTVKPTALVMDVILDCSRRKDIILDPFAGSGTTLVAAHKAKRRGFGIEIDPLYCDTIVRRMQSLFKLEAVRQSDGKSFAECLAAGPDARGEVAA